MPTADFDTYLGWKNRGRRPSGSPAAHLVSPDGQARVPLYTEAQTYRESMSVASGLRGGWTIDDHRPAWMTIPDDDREPAI